MIRLLTSLALTLLSAACGLLITSLILDNFSVRPIGFTSSVLMFVVVTIVAEPLILKLSIKYLPAIRGGVALVTTFISLLFAHTLTDGLSISGASTWVLASLIVWISVLIASIILPLFLFKQAVTTNSGSTTRNA